MSADMRRVKSSRLRRTPGPGYSVTWSHSRRVRRVHGYAPAVPKRRLDTLLAERGLFRRARGRRPRCWRARCASAPGAGRRKPGQLVADDVALALAERPAFVSRGGIKLANALDALGLDPAGRRCLDVGASTGGFTDCLLQRGAEAVVALDVAYGELDWRCARTRGSPWSSACNARALEPVELPFAPDLVVADVSFISLAQGAARGAGRRRAAFDCLAMVKPQFEVGREQVGKGGVVRDAGGPPRARWSPWRDARDELGAAVLGLRVVGPARARRATARASSGSPRPAAPGAVEDLDAAARRAEP